MILWFFSTLPLVPLSNFTTHELQMLLINPYRSSVVSDHLGQRPVLSLSVSVCVHIFLSLSFYPSHYMQHWGCLRDQAWKENISCTTIHGESDTGLGGWERGRKREGEVDDRWMDARITTFGLCDYAADSQSVGESVSSPWVWLLKYG